MFEFLRSIPIVLYMNIAESQEKVHDVLPFLDRPLIRVPLVIISTTFFLVAIYKVASIMAKKSSEELLPPKERLRQSRWWILICAIAFLAMTYFLGLYHGDFILFER